MKFNLHNYILKIYQSSWKRNKFFIHFYPFLKAFIQIWEQNSLRQFCLCFTLTLSHDIFQLPIYYRNMDFFVCEVPVFCEILNSLRGAERNLSAAETTLIRWKKKSFQHLKMQLNNRSKCWNKISPPYCYSYWNTNSCLESAKIFPQCDNNDKW